MLKFEIYFLIIIIKVLSSSCQLQNNVHGICEHIFKCKKQFDRIEYEAHNEPIECTIFDFFSCKWYDLPMNLTTKEKIDFESNLTSKYNYDDVHFKWFLTDTNQVLYFSNKTHLLQNDLPRVEKKSIFLKSNQFMADFQLIGNFNLTCHVIPKWYKRFKTLSFLKSYLVNGVNVSVKILNDNQIQQCTLEVNIKKIRQLSFLDYFPLNMFLSLFGIFCSIFTILFLTCCFMIKKENTRADTTSELLKLSRQIELIRPVYYSNLKNIGHIDRLLVNLKNAQNCKPIIRNSKNDRLLSFFLSKTVSDDRN